MANEYEPTIEEMINELNGLKESSAESMGRPLPRTQVNVLSTSSDQIVIHINVINTHFTLNQTIY